MKNFLLNLSILLLATTAIYAQPSAMPAAGYQWVKTGGNTYTAGPTSTTPFFGSGNTQFGVAGDSDPANAALSCGGNADGFYPGGTTPGTIYKKLFGTNNGLDPITLCEQRAHNLTQWTNAFPNSGVSNGAIVGTVYLPTAANLNILSGNNAPGTGAGGTNNRAWIIGGNGGANTSSFNAKVDYNVDWSTAAFGGKAGGSGTQTQTGSFNGNEPGGSNYNQVANWTANFGQSFAQSFVIPTNVISETGGTFEVKYVSNSTASVLARNFGNGDGMIAHDPGMEGRASFVVNYDIWEIQSILPLYLINFNVNKATIGTQINWQTNNETNNVAYNIQSSTDGINYTTVKTIPVSTTRVGNYYNYTYNDAAPLTGKKYYRLQVLETNSKVSYSKIIAIQNNTPTKFEIVNNGGKNYTITVATNAVSVLNVYTQNGQLVNKFELNKGNTLLTIDLNKYGNALYFISLQSQGELPKTLKVIAQ